MLTFEQRQLRAQGIGASETASILGLNPYSSALDLYIQKTSPVSEVDELADNEAVYWGSNLEAPIANRYAQLNNVELLDSPTVVHPKHNFILATPDRLIANSKKLIEIKTVGPHAIKQWADNKIPQNYFIQCAQLLYVLDYESIDLVALMCGQELKTFTINRDEKMDLIIESTCLDFWNNHVLPKIPPKADYNSPNTLEAIKKLYKEVDGDSRIDLTDEETLTWIKSWTEAKKQISKFEAIAKISQAALLDRMQNNNVGVLPDGSFLQRKIQKRKGFTTKDTEFVTLTFREKK